MLKSAWQLPIIVAALMGAGPASAADIWVAANVRGAVFELVNDQWTELKNGDGIGNGIAVRTLQAGRVRLVRQGQILALDPDTAILATGGGTGVTVQQYAGTVMLTGSNVVHAQLVTPVLVATVSGASVVSRVNGSAASLSVALGRVAVQAQGRHLVVGAGQTISFASGGRAGAVTPAPPIVAPDSGPGSDPSTTPLPRAPAPSGGPASPAGPATPAAAPPAPGSLASPDPRSVKSDNGVGNGGIPGNGGQNGNGGGSGKK